MHFDFTDLPHRVILGRDVYLAPTAYVGGDVTLGDGCTVMHHVVIRGDVSPIRVGARCNIQDGTILHTNRGVPLDIEDDVSIGHRAVVHCRRVGAGSLIGIGTIVLDDCEIGRGCLIAAGAVVPPRTLVPDGKLVMGIPGRNMRDVNDAERLYFQEITASYLHLGRLHAAGQYPNAAPGVAPANSR
jgi:carbonic anhydrase/acetyltransferase-like protein (isoleucine patch superfamily)